MNGNSAKEVYDLIRTNHKEVLDEQKTMNKSISELNTEVRLIKEKMPKQPCSKLSDHIEDHPNNMIVNEHLESVKLKGKNISSIFLRITASVTAGVLMMLIGYYLREIGLV